MGSYGKGLAYTGLGSVTIGGATFGQLWIVGFAVGLVVVGAGLTRLGYRRNKGINTP
jgi:hypothetical protein